MKSRNECKIFRLEPLRLASDEVMVVDWAYYVNSENHFGKDVAPNHQCDCKAYHAGEVPKLSNGAQAKGFKLHNSATEVLCFLDFPNEALGRGNPQCDQLIYKEKGESKLSWCLLLELKYCGQTSASCPSMQAKYREAVRQIESVYQHIVDCEQCRQKFTGRVCGVVAFPQIKKGQSASIMSGIRKEMKKITLQKLPEIASEISVADVYNGYWIVKQPLIGSH